ncbi:MAG TPA: PrpF domain-containing protein [Candidatus Limnocylindrales bacterium]|nr:PrpF domain-containing protein [Candidatus Limnocylindrales bacterium]
MTQTLERRPVGAEQPASDHVSPGPWPGAIRRGDQVGIRCVFMRGGTSRGAILHAADMPADPVLREQLILAIYGSPDVREIDGLGGADPLTSKVAIVGPSSRADADVDFVFGQVRIAEPHVDFTGNCGNMSAAIGPFAIEEGLVPAVEPVTTVRVYLVNTDAVLTARVPVRDGLAEVSGDAEVPGVPGTGAPIVLDFGEGADTLGRGLLPTGMPLERLVTPEGEVEVSIVDAANPAVFVRPEAFGLRGTELPDAFTPELLASLELVRAAAAVRLGLAASPDEAAAVTPAVPKLYLVSPPADYVDLSGRPVKADSIDVVGRGLSMRVPHQAYAGTVAICTGVAARIPGTLVAEVARPTNGRFRIGHPSGVMAVEVGVTIRNGQPALERAGIVRTARRIMAGTVFVPASRLDEAVS